MDKITRPASLDRLKRKKSGEELFYDRLEKEVLYLIQWRKMQMKEGGH